MTLLVLFRASSVWWKYFLAQACAKFSGKMPIDWVLNYVQKMQNGGSKLTLGCHISEFRPFGSK